jgi:hypothetical protein
VLLHLLKGGDEQIGIHAIDVPFTVTDQRGRDLIHAWIAGQVPAGEFG